VSSNPVSYVRFGVFTAVTMKNAVFWDVALCRSCVNRRFGGTWLQPPAHAGSSLANFSTMKMEAICSSETSVHTRSTQRHISEDGILQSCILFVTSQIEISSQIPYVLNEILCSFTQSLQETSRTVNLNRPRALHFTLLLVYYFSRHPTIPCCIIRALISLCNL
jgi:hypothetical protein